MEQPEDYPRWYTPILAILVCLPIGFAFGLAVGHSRSQSPSFQGWFDQVGWLYVFGVPAIVQAVIACSVEIRRYRNVKARQASRTEF